MTEPYIARMYKIEPMGGVGIAMPALPAVSDIFVFFKVKARSAHYVGILCTYYVLGLGSIGYGYGLHG